MCRSPTAARGGDPGVIDDVDGVAVDNPQHERGRRDRIGVRRGRRQGQGSHASAYQTQFPKPSWAEQNPEDWWRCMGEAVRGAVNAAGIRVKDVLALCVDTTCCSVVAADPDGKPLRPAMIWMDVRSAAEAADVAASGDPALRINSDGRGPVSAEWMIPKSLWMKRNQPELFERAAHI